MLRPILTTAAALAILAPAASAGTVGRWTRVSTHRRSSVSSASCRRRPAGRWWRGRLTPPPGANGVATVTVPAGTPTVKLRRAGYAEGEVGVR